MHVCELHCPKENRDLDSYDEDSVKKGQKSSVTEEGRREQMQGTAPASRSSQNIIKPNRLSPQQVSVQRHLTGRRVGT